MALVKKEEHETGVTLTEGYYRVIGVNMQVDNRIEVTVRLYKDSAARKNGKMPIQDKVYVPSEEETTAFFSLELLSQTDNNPFKAAYGYLKTLPDFETATDA